MEKMENPPNPQIEAGAKYDQLWTKIDGLQARIRDLRNGMQKALG